MFKIDITYPNLFEPGETTEETYFHLFKKNLLDLEQEFLDKSEGKKGLGDRLEEVGKGKDGLQMILTFTRLVQAAYGIRDGNKFLHTAQASEEWIGGPAYDRFLTMLLTNPKLAEEFTNGVMPVDLAELADAIKTADAGEVEVLSIENAELIAKIKATSGLKNPFDSDGNPLPWWNREPTAQERQRMPHANLLEVFDRKSSGWTPPTT